MVASIQSLDSEYGCCNACGVLNEAEWGMSLRSDRLRQHHAYFRLCDQCRIRLMEHMRETPDRGPVPLRGYT